jgi:segregation and condensation protein B
MPRLATTIEAILYLKGQPLSIADIAKYAGCNQDEDSALEVIESPLGYCLQLRDLFQALVQTMIPVDLGVGALRTLAAIALRAPISQTQLVELRGSGAYQHVQELVEQGFVRKRRRADSRSQWLQVTDKFHQYFQIDKLPQEFRPRKSEELDEPEQLSLDSSIEQLEHETIEHDLNPNTELS